MPRRFGSGHHVCLGASRCAAATVLGRSGWRTYREVTLRSRILLAASEGGTDLFGYGMLPSRSGEVTILSDKSLASIGCSRYSSVCYSGQALAMLVRISLEFEGHVGLSQASTGISNEERPGPESDDTVSKVPGKFNSLVQKGARGDGPTDSVTLRGKEEAGSCKVEWAPAAAFVYKLWRHCPRCSRTLSTGATRSWITTRGETNEETYTIATDNTRCFWEKRRLQSCCCSLDLRG